jgi:DNA (cytosine-5)-methyltransferase 1
VSDQPRPRLLDLFCGAGGAAMGYHRAGFEVVGVDIKPQPHYPFEFIQADVMDLMAWKEQLGFIPDAIHASPPCQAYSITRHLPWVRHTPKWDSVPPTLALLRSSGLPWVLENVVGAPVDGIMLCGTMFGLRMEGKPVYRHRLFQSTLFMLAPGHPKHFETIVAGSRSMHRQTMQSPDTDWMSQREARQAIPPAYTEWIGHQLLQAIERNVA